MPSDETEWSMQKRLTKSWLRTSLVQLAGEPLFLTAWEVMTDYRVNDSRRHWNAPSIDFLFLDVAGRMVLVELKREIRTPREGWSVACQVSHRAQALAAGFSQPRLEAAYDDCHSGLDGRTATAGKVAPLVDAHAAAFDRPPLHHLPARPIRRIVMAASFAPSFRQVLSAFNSGNHEQVETALGRYKLRGEIKRYLDLGSDLSLVDEHPIQAVTPDGGAWSGAPRA